MIHVWAGFSSAYSHLIWRSSFTWSSFRCRLEPLAWNSGLPTETLLGNVLCQAELDFDIYGLSDVRSEQSRRTCTIECDSCTLAFHQISIKPCTTSQVIQHYKWDGKGHTFAWTWLCSSDTDDKSCAASPFSKRNLHTLVVHGHFWIGPASWSHELNCEKKISEADITEFLHYFPRHHTLYWLESSIGAESEHFSEYDQLRSKGTEGQVVFNELGKMLKTRLVIDLFSCK